MCRVKLALTVEQVGVVEELEEGETLCLFIIIMGGVVALGYKPNITIKGGGGGGGALEKGGGIFFLSFTVEQICVVEELEEGGRLLHQLRKPPNERLDLGTK